MYCYDTGKAATVVSVKAPTGLQLNDDIFQGSGYDYFIYQEGAQTGLGNTGAFLYMGGSQDTGTLHVTTIGGDDMIVGKISKPFFPIQIKKVWFTDTADLVGDLYAVW